MAKIDIGLLKSKFEDGDTPTGTDFANLIDTLTDYNDLQTHAALTTAHGGPYAIVTHTHDASDITNISTGGGTIVTSDSPTISTPTIVSPVLTGTPTAPTATVGDNSTQIATTSFVDVAITNASLGGTVDTSDFAKLSQANSYAAVQTFNSAVREKVVAMSADDVNLSAGSIFTKTISGNTTFTVSNVASVGNSSSFVLELTNGGSSVITWFNGIKWAGGNAPSLTSVGTDVMGFYTHDGGNTWAGMILAKDIK